MSRCRATSAQRCTPSTPLTRTQTCWSLLRLTHDRSTLSRWRPHPVWPQAFRKTNFRLRQRSVITSSVRPSRTLEWGMIRVLWKIKLSGRPSWKFKKLQGSLICCHICLLIMGRPLISLGMRNQDSFWIHITARLSSGTYSVNGTKPWLDRKHLDFTTNHSCSQSSFSLLIRLTTGLLERFVHMLQPSWV